MDHVLNWSPAYKTRSIFPKLLTTDIYPTICFQIYFPVLYSTPYDITHHKSETNFKCFLYVAIQDPFSIYGWVRSEPMGEDVTYVTSSLVGSDLAQPYRKQAPAFLNASSLPGVHYILVPWIRIMSVEAEDTAQTPADQEVSLEVSLAYQSTLHIDALIYWSNKASDTWRGATVWGILQALWIMLKWQKYIRSHQ